ncbi:uncharacterized protein CBO05P1_232 [Clostridium botulinum B str. Osaka05]|uniref:Uncharacterized protein n=1 Tax=Clostridium botulinum B str. Osaka05 TaxID=1407017 RepID=A0A060N395_CLOBO|nr:hypothetical protein [Clostridium botulinum]BAO04951.1 uncharacterized protein CBO05P1_232 [Clostridium botulinum B str. Osaka05]
MTNIEIQDIITKAIDLKKQISEGIKENIYGQHEELCMSLDKYEEILGDITHIDYMLIANLENEKIDLNYWTNELTKLRQDKTNIINKLKGIVNLYNK